jgi:tryptophan synthase alpha chain
MSGVERLSRALDTALARGRKSLIPYWTSGFPDRGRFRDVARRILAEGPEAFEIGVPFSDPLADGPVIQAASQRALEQGTTLSTTLEDAERLAAEFPRTPLLLMSYLNPLRAAGLARAMRRIAAAGVAGVIVPDRDLLAPGEVLEPARAAGLAVPPLVAPTTPLSRLPALLAGAGGFVYVVSVAGVTGARSAAPAVAAAAARLRGRTRLPLCVGFGIANAAQAEAVARCADGVIAGSALIAPFLREPFARACAGLRRKLRELREGLDRAGTKP